MKAHETNPTRTLMQMINGYRLTQMIHVAAKLEIADLLKNGAQHSNDLARATGTDSSSLYRLLRALAGAGILSMSEEENFSLTPLGELLRQDSPASLWGWAITSSEPSVWQAWGDLLYSVKTGETGFRHVHGISNWEYREKHPEANAIFNQALASGSRARANALVKYTFAPAHLIVDVGGGHGTNLAAILVKNPALRGILFDQPHVTSGAMETLRSAGASDRCEIIGGDFFKAVPAGGDIYLLSYIIHDWDDDSAIAILRNCQQAMANRGRVMLFERIVPQNPQDGLGAFLADLNMLVNTGGRERTTDEYQTLFAKAGLDMVRVVPLDSDHAIYEAKRV